MFIIEVIKAILFGIVEGVTEWLPISSTGHLILIQDFIQFKDQNPAFMEMFNVVIQLGAILAVVVIYFDKLNPLNQASQHVRFKRLGSFGPRSSWQPCRLLLSAYSWMIGLKRISTI